jgi:hypothetical protein
MIYSEMWYWHALADIFAGRAFHVGGVGSVPFGPDPRLHLDTRAGHRKSSDSCGGYIRDASTSAFPTNSEGLRGLHAKSLRSLRKSSQDLSRKGQLWYNHR